MMHSESVRTPWRLIALLFFAGALAASQYAKIPWMLPGLLKNTPMSSVQQALLLSLVGALGAAGGAFAGALGQRFGLVRTLNAGLVLAVCGALLPLAESAYPVLLVARLVESVGHMAIVVAAPTLMLGLAAKRDRSRVMTVWSCYFTLTFVVVAVAAPSLLALAGWRGFAIAHALLLSGVCIASVRLLGEGAVAQQAAGTRQPKRQPAQKSASAQTTMGWDRVAASQWRLLRNVRLLVIPLTFLGYTLLFVSLVSVLPRMLGDTPQHIFLLGFALPGCSLLGTLTALFLVSRQIRPWRMVRGAAIMLVVTGVGLCLTQAHDEVAIGLCLSTFLMMGLLPAGIIGSLPDLFDSSDPDVTLVNGGLVQFGNLGNFLGPPLLASLIAQAGWTSIGLYLCGGAGLVLVCLWPLGRSVERVRVMRLEG